jgi:hypothetical protein
MKPLALIGLLLIVVGLAGLLSGRHLYESRDGHRHRAVACNRRSTEDAPVAAGGRNCGGGWWRGALDRGHAQARVDRLTMDESLAVALFRASFDEVLREPHEREDLTPL